jgi:transcription-repair coupling factor (superfamily II helicase)
VESIRDFDPDTQLSVAKVDHIQLLPAREFALDKNPSLVSASPGGVSSRVTHKRSLIYREVSAGHAPGGIEYYLPLFFEPVATLFDHLPESTLAIRLDGVAAAMAAFQEQIMERYEQHPLRRRAAAVTATGAVSGSDASRAGIGALSTG